MLTNGLNKQERALLPELLAKFNARRAKKGYSRVTLDKLPTPPRPLGELYLVDTYQVRRHWRRRPTNK